MGDDDIDMRHLERDLTMLLGEVKDAGLSPASLLGMMDVMKAYVAQALPGQRAQPPAVNRPARAGE